MSRPIPTWVVHFTRVEHLPSIIANGIHCDREAQDGDLLSIEVGNAGIKARRRNREVPVGPAGTVADYVPFYFGVRSPMMSAITHGAVEGYTGGTERLIYLCSTIEALVELGRDVVVTDRNAVLDYTSFARWADGEPEEDFIDWPLMKQEWWNNTEEHPDRKERRMAECLVHRSVSWEAITYVGTKSEDVATEVRNALDAIAHVPTVGVHRNWYI